jgi:hypothetical protein
LARHDQAALTPTTRTHRLSGDYAEDVLAPRFDNVASRVAGHQQHPPLFSSPPHPDVLVNHVAILGRENVQDHLTRPL